MTAFFLSDTHLRSEAEPRYQKLLLFLDRIKAEADHLYLAGDIFDFWFCSNERIYPEFVPLIAKLKDLQASGTRIHFAEGNHDFYMGDYFTGRLGMEVSPEWADFVLDGQRILLAHGDTVDQQNSRYLLLRRILRSGLFFRFQRMIPAVLRWKLAALSSDLSKEVNEVSRELLLVKMQAFAVNKFKEGYDAVVLGHCHRPFLKRFSIKETGGEREKVFASLGDWVENYSYLIYKNGEFRLEFFDA